jgi:hypothetical protein
VVAFSLFGLGALGTLAVVSTTILEAEVISVASGICFFLSATSLSIWFYALARQHNALLPLQSDNIKELATKKLVIVLGTTTFFGGLLFLFFSRRCSLHRSSHPLPRPSCSMSFRSLCWQSQP